MKPMKTAWLIYNPAAGPWPVARFIGSAARALRERGWEVTLRPSQGRDDLTAQARQAAAAGVDVCFVAGGDGSVNAAVEGLVGSQTALGVLPAGTSNVLARDLGLPPFTWAQQWRLAENAALLAESPALAADVGWCGERPFLMWAGIGLDALAVHSLEPRPRYQKYFTTPVYAWAVVSALNHWQGQVLRVETDERQVEGRFLLAVACNIRRYMGGLTLLSPDGYLDDGEMDLWLFGGRDLRMALNHAFWLLSNRHEHSPDVMHLRFRRARLQAETTVPTQVDGEPGALVRECNLRVQPGALRLLTPPQGQRLFRRLHEEVTG